MSGRTEVSPLVLMSALVMSETAFGTLLRSASICVAVTVMGSRTYVRVESGRAWAGEGTGMTATSEEAIASDRASDLIGRFILGSFPLT
jgi:hypothetical protein